MPPDYGNNNASGYPVLVSMICKCIDEDLSENLRFDNPAAAWTSEGIAEAVKLMLKSNIPLFDSMIKQLDLYPKLRQVIEKILFQGERTAFSPAEKYMNLGCMFGFLKEQDGGIEIANRIFEMYLMDLFMAEALLDSGIKTNL